MAATYKDKKRLEMDPHVKLSKRMVIVLELYYLLAEKYQQLKQESMSEYEPNEWEESRFEFDLQPLLP